MNFDNTYVSIDLDAISNNFDRIAAKAGTQVMAIIKADAYGHGAIQVAKLLRNKCNFFGVSSMLEALELRQAGLDTPILILGQTPIAAFPEAIRLGIRPAIFHYEDAVALSQEAVRQNIQAPFHFAVDTGMSRIGFPVTEEAADICAAIAKLPNLRAEGLSIPVVGSSDVHKLENNIEFPYHYTLCFAKENEPEAILDAVKNQLSVAVEENGKGYDIGHLVHAGTLRPRGENHLLRRGLRCIPGPGYCRDVRGGTHQGR